MFHLVRFDWTLRLGDLALTGFLAVVGYGLRKFYTVLIRFVQRVDKHGAVIDRHSSILEARGFTDGQRLPRVAHPEIELLLAVALGATLGADPLAAQAVDQIDISQATVERSAPDVASWPITTAITRLEIGATDCSVEFDKKGIWPDVLIPGWGGGSIAYTLWMVRLVGGQVYTGGGIEFWNGRGKNACGPAAEYINNWYYDGSWGPLNTAGELTPGETVGFFVTAGDARAKDVRTVTARSAVVAVPWPGGAGAVFTFGEAPAPAPVPPPPPPPPVFVPPAPPVPPVPVVVAPAPGVPGDLLEQVRRLVELEADTNAKVTRIDAQVRTFADQFGSVMMWIGKYVAPAIGAWVLARQMQHDSTTPAAVAK
jgi:hypothetical protein